MKFEGLWFIYEDLNDYEDRFILANPATFDTSNRWENSIDYLLYDEESRKYDSEDILKCHNIRRVKALCVINGEFTLTITAKQLYPEYFL